MAIDIKGVKRIVIAVADLDKACKRYVYLFNIKPYAYGAEPDKGYHWLAFELGSEKTTMEFISPLNNDDSSDPITKFIDRRGEGIYMITLEANGDIANTIESMRDLGLDSKKSISFTDMPLSSAGDMAESWHEVIIGPKEAHGVMYAITEIKYKDLGVRNCNKGRNVCH